MTEILTLGSFHIAAYPRLISVTKQVFPKKGQFSWDFCLKFNHVNVRRGLLRLQWVLL